MPTSINIFVKFYLQKWLDKPFLDDDEIDKLELQLSLLNFKGD